MAFEKYHKINSLFKRDNKGNFITGQFSCPEFEYLFDNQWVGTEKIDGTNIRIHWNGTEFDIQGRTDNAQTPPFLMERLEEMVAGFDMKAVFPDAEDVVLFGEGYGAKIQKAGGLYKPDGVDFILFDVKIGPWWMKREAVNEIAEKLGILAVPVIFRGTLSEAMDMVRVGFDSTIGTAKAEGLVLTPEVDLFARRGDRVITKLKTKDFN